MSAKQVEKCEVPFSTHDGLLQIGDLRKLRAEFKVLDGCTCSGEPPSHLLDRTAHCGLGAIPIGRLTKTESHCGETALARESSFHDFECSRHEGDILDRAPVPPHGIERNRKWLDTFRADGAVGRLEADAPAIGTRSNQRATSLRTDR